MATVLELITFVVLLLPLGGVFALRHAGNSQRGALPPGMRRGAPLTDLVMSARGDCKIALEVPGMRADLGLITPWHEGPPRYVVFGHHKAGTYLLWHILADLSRVQNLTCSVCYTGCPTDSIWFPATSLVSDLEQLWRYPDAKAVHVVRRPTDMVVSEYCYAKRIRPDMDSLLTQEYRRHDVAWGIRQACADLQDTISEMLAVRSAIQEANSPRILQLRYESFKDDFDGVTRSIFEHFLGKSHGRRVERLVNISRRHDIHRLGPKTQDMVDVLDGLHHSSVEDKTAARAELTRQVASGEPCLRSMAELDVRLGYDRIA